MENRLGQAVCLGVHKGDPRDAWRTLCHTSRMCPSCEARKAARRANGIRKRLHVWDFLTEGDFTVGVLTTTLPGASHWVRHASLKDQYDYITERRQNTHSMRGLNFSPYSALEPKAEPISLNSHGPRIMSGGICITTVSSGVMVDSMASQQRLSTQWMLTSCCFVKASGDLQTDFLRGWDSGQDIVWITPRVMNWRC